MSHRQVGTLGALAFLLACAWAGWNAGASPIVVAQHPGATIHHMR